MYARIYRPAVALSALYPARRPASYRLHPRGYFVANTRVNSCSGAAPDGRIKGSEVLAVSDKAVALGTVATVVVAQIGAFSASNKMAVTELKASFFFHLVQRAPRLLAENTGGADRFTFPQCSSHPRLWWPTQNRVSQTIL